MVNLCVERMISGLVFTFYVSEVDGDGVYLDEDFILAGL